MAIVEARTALRKATREKIDTITAAIAQKIQTMICRVAASASE